MEFFNEELTKDDLYFYLHAWNLLFKGPVLLKESNRIKKIIWVDMIRVLEFLETLLVKLDGAEYNKIKWTIEEEAGKDTEK